MSFFLLLHVLHEFMAIVCVFSTSFKWKPHKSNCWIHTLLWISHTLPWISHIVVSKLVPPSTSFLWISHAENTQFFRRFWVWKIHTLRIRRDRRPKRELWTA